MSANSKPPLVAVLPTSLTLANAVCGFAAISYATIPSEATFSPHLYTAGLLILLAMVFDALDGAVARLTKQTSSFGAELDSLCDVISFGVAPAVLLVQMPHVLPTRLLWCIALLFVLCATLRLARFNATPDEAHDSNWFTGLPSPAAAAVIASIAVVWPGVEQLAAGAAGEVKIAAQALIHFAPRVNPWLMLTLACLMVSKIRYPHPSKQLLHGKRPLIHVVQIVFIVIAAFAIHELALPLACLAFAVGSPLRALGSQGAAGIARLKHPELELER